MSECRFVAGSLGSGGLEDGFQLFKAAGVLLLARCGENCRA